MRGKVSFSPLGQALFDSEYGTRPLRGRLATVGKRRDCLIISALEADKGVKISLTFASPHADKILFFPFDSLEWELTYLPKTQLQPAIMATRCEATRKSLAFDGTEPILRCVSRSGHAGSHHYINRHAERPNATKK
jgi:hypothetical protein